MKDMFILIDIYCKMHAASLDAAIEVDTFLCTLLYICTRYLSALFSLRQSVAVLGFLSPILPSPDPEGFHILFMP